MILILIALVIVGANLRDVPCATNCENQRRARSDNKTGFLGVTQVGRRYLAQIGSAGKIIKIGRFDTPVAAHSAYLAAKRALHTGCRI